MPMWFPKDRHYATMSFSNARKEKKSVDSGEAFGTLLTDLSKAFDCINHAN